MKYSGMDIEKILSTKERIFFVAIEMFATKGFAAVSIRDIAKAVGIKPASIYNHYSSKEEILDELIEFIKETTNAYYERLNAAIHMSSGFEEVMDCLFKELEKVHGITIYYGIALLSVEQFSNDAASTALNDVYLKNGIEYMDKVFSYCIAKGWTRQFDSKACATLIMNSALTGSLVRVHEDNGGRGAYQAAEMFISLKKFLFELLKK